MGPGDRERIGFDWAGDLISFYITAKRWLTDQVMDFNVTIADLSLPSGGEGQTKQEEEPGRAGNWCGAEAIFKARSEDGESSTGRRPDMSSMVKKYPGGSSWQTQPEQIHEKLAKARE